MIIFNKFQIKARKQPLGKWATFILYSGLMESLLIFAVLFTLFMQFRKKIIQTIEMFFCLNLEPHCFNVQLSYLANTTSTALIIVFIFIVAFLLIASSYIRHITAELIFPTSALFTLWYITQKIEFNKMNSFDYIYQFIICLSALSASLFFIFFEFASPDEEKAHWNRWLAYWKFRFWEEKSSYDHSIMLYFKLPICAAIKLVYLDSFGIKCPMCRKSFFLKSISSVNPMAEQCEHCGFNTKNWAKDELRKTPSRVFTSARGLVIKNFKTKEKSK